jgi:hypothetical protein
MLNKTNEKNENHCGSNLLLLGKNEMGIIFLACLHKWRKG